MESPTEIPYSGIPGFPEPTVAGHAGRLVFGVLEGVSVVLQAGRCHLYEGHSASTVALPTRMLAALGIDVLVVTNAAGGLCPTLRPPSLMLLADHVNLMWRNPLVGELVQGEQRFPDMADLYDRELRALAREVAREQALALHEGTYAAVAGPSYETLAEVRMLRRLGVDAVGMSTVPEVLAARARGVRVLAVSSITNLAAGLSGSALSHAEVLRAGRALGGQLETLLRGVLRGL